MELTSPCLPREPTAHPQPISMTFLCIDCQSGPTPTAARARTSADAANSAVRLLLDRAGPFDLIYERYSLWSVGAMEYARSSGTAGLLEINAPLIDEEARYRRLTDPVSAMRFTRQSFSTASILIVVSEFPHDVCEAVPGP